MSRWTNSNKYAFKKHYNVWAGQKLIYNMHTDQGNFTLTSYEPISYKKTAAIYYKKGFTGIQISFIGRDVTF